MNWVTRLYYLSRRWLKAGRLFLAIAGPGIVVMIADNDAGGITTYAATGAKFRSSTSTPAFRSAEGAVVIPSSGRPPVPTTIGSPPSRCSRKCRMIL
jgi:hypothetical protein